MKLGKISKALIVMFVLLLTISSTMPVGVITANAANSSSAQCDLGKPAKVIVKTTADSLTIKWSAVEGATGYRIYNRAEGKWFVAVSSTKATSHTFKNLKQGKQYVLAVRAYKIVGGKALWAPGYTTAVGTTLTNLGKPAVTASATASSIKLNWIKVPGATGYRIYYRAGGQWKIAVNGTTKLTHTFSGLKANSKYVLAVRAYQKVNGKTVWANDYTKVTVTTKDIELGAPKNIVIEQTMTTVELSWSKVSGAAGYRVYQKVEGGWKTLKNTTKTNYLVRNLTPGTNYEFAIIAYKLVDGKAVFANKYSVAYARTASKTMTNDEYADIYNSVVNAYKKYNGSSLLKVNETYALKVTDASTPEIIDTMQAVADKFARTSKSRYLFVKGEDCEGRTPADLMPPYRKAAGLTGEGIKTASHVKNDDGGFTVTYKLAAESILFNGVRNTYVGKNHRNIMDMVDLGTTDFGAINIDNAKIALPETTLVVTVDKDGRLVSLTQDVPMVVDADFSVANASASCEVEVRDTAVYTVKYY